MPSPPRLPLQSAAIRVERDASLTVELASAVAGARRRALRDGDRQLDTAHLLHSLIEADPEVSTALGPASQVARVLGYLVQRTIGYGLRWQGSVEDSGAVPVVHQSGSGATTRRDLRTPHPDSSGWSPSALAAMAGAERCAVLDGRESASGTDLLAALASDPDCRAVEVLSRAGVDIKQLGERTGVC